MSITRNILVLALTVCVGCQSVARPAPWQTRRVPSSPPIIVSPPVTVSPPAKVSPTKPPSRSPQWQPTPAEPNGKRVPEPTPDPQAKNGSKSLSNKLNAQTNQPVAPGAKQPQLRFQPVLPRSSSEREPTNGAAIGSRDIAGGVTTPDLVVSPPKNVGPKRSGAIDDALRRETNKPIGPSLGFEALPPPNDSLQLDSQSPDSPPINLPSTNSRSSDSPLNLIAKAPRQRPVGGTVTFDIVVRNDSTEPMANVLVNADFEDALVFPGREEKHVQKNLGQLAPGQSSKMRLTLTSNRLGQHECRFTVSADDIDPLEQTKKVEFIDPKLLVRLIGPARRTVGSRAEFTVKIANTSDQPINDLQVTLHHDAALTPHIATGGFQKEANALRWSLGRLESGAGVQVQAEFDCKQLSEQSCITAEARSEQLSAVAVEDCVTVVAVPGLLDLRVSDVTDPIQVGDEAEYEITVQNLGLQAVSDVQLDMQTSEHLKPGTHDAKLDDRAVTLTPSDHNGILRLVLPGSLAPDATLKITLRAKVLRPGDAEVRVVATLGTDPAAVEATEFTSINP